MGQRGTRIQAIVAELNGEKVDVVLWNEDASQFVGEALSPAEVIDAARAVESVGLERRDRFRAALSATLAKDARARETFERTFDRFFATPARGTERGTRKSEGGPGGGERPRRAASHAARGAGAVG